MFRKIAGLLILISFMLVKADALFTVLEKQYAVEQHQDDQGAEKSAENEKETKSFEIADELIPHQVPVPALVELTQKLNHIGLPYVPAVHIAVWGPPPNPAV